MPRMLDLFCGLGGASAAMRARGWDVLGVDAEEALRPDVVADLATWHYQGPPVDLLWASPPCTEFARRDKRCWFPEAPDPDCGLVAAALRLVMEIRPRWWLIENVRGARPYLGALLGPPALQSPPLYLWGRPPPGLLLPPGRAFKEQTTGSTTDPRLAGWAWERRRAQLRAVVPFEISHAIARAAELALDGEAGAAHAP